MVEYEDIVLARDRLHEEILLTPLTVWRHGSARTGRRIGLKLETLQRTGSFKARGAWNRIRRLVPEERKRGVICASAGNHAQGVAFAAQRVGTHATIVMPEGAPEIKQLQTRLYGDPEIILHGADLTAAYERAVEIREERGLVFVHPYDDNAIIAGQGTIGLEILEAWPDVDAIVVPVGGGGLAAGIAVAVAGRAPGVKVVGVQAKGADAMVRSLEAGRPVDVDAPRTCADGIKVGRAGERTFALLERHGVPVLRVGEDAIRAAITALGQTAKLVVEPAGAAAAAVLLAGPEELADRGRIVCVLSGANVDLPDLADTLTRFPDVPTTPVDWPLRG